MHSDTKKKKKERERETTLFSLKTKPLAHLCSRIFKTPILTILVLLFTVLTLDYLFCMTMHILKAQISLSALYSLFQMCLVVSEQLLLNLFRFVVIQPQKGRCLCDHGTYYLL